jgi:pyruvate/2-oxoglutarate dehydrogenase complex dihydrolipoamide dehydrogenase (E3) component
MTGIQPDDVFNRELVALTAPEDWENPTAAGVYNLVVIGGGTAGLVAALGAAGLGAKVALIEGGMMGGDCLNWGCVPSKALIRSARAAYDAREAQVFGVSTGPVSVDFAAVMQRMRQLRTGIAHHDSFERVKREGVDAFRGRARFTSGHTVQVAGQTLTFRRAVIATGATAFVPPIDGIDRVDVLTNETVFQLTEMPARLLVVGGGPIGCELAQCFRRFGAEVQIVDMADRLLTKDDPEAAEIVKAQLLKEGVALHLGAGVTGFRKEGSESVCILKDGTELRADRVLMAVGRRANTEGLDLDKAGVRVERGNVVVNDFLQTTNPDVYASGDVTGMWQFTHAADHMSRMVIGNALFFGRSKASRLVMPWATFTDPEVAHVGITGEEAEKRGCVVTRVGLDQSDRSKLDGDTIGFAKVYSEGGKPVGATIVARHAGELIGELSLAITAGLTMGQIAKTIHPYPTQAEVVWKTGTEFNRGRLTPRLRDWAQWLLSWRR